MRLLTLLLATSVLAAGCAGGGRRIAPSPSPRATLPPADADALAAMYAEELEALEVRLTRAGLVDRTDGQWEYAPDGTHLALYVEPVGDVSTDDYVDRIVTVTRLFGSTVFERWSGLETFDVCQEPPPGEDDSAEPPPVSQVTMRRDAAEEIDWPALTLADLLTLARDPEENENGIRMVTVSTSGRIVDHPDFQAAQAKAEEVSVGSA